MTPDLIHTVCAATEPVIGAIGPEQHALSTPCTDWNIGQLLNHVIGALHLGAALLSDTAPMVAVGPGQVPADDLVGDDALAAYRAGVAALESAATHDAIASAHVTPMGELPGAALAGFVTLDVLVHGWDLATATGQPARLDPELAETMLAFATQAMPEGQRGPLMADPVAVGSDADATDRLVAFTGRNP
jgi:uncharacterized protein (TIGR03086 family)